MANLSWILVALFLPLFPLGIVFNALFQNVRNAWLRALLLLAWPLAGLGLLQWLPGTVPDVVTAWALFSAVLYGFRAVVVREVAVWSGFLATSAWALIWIALAAGVPTDVLILYTLAFSLPLLLLVLLTAELEFRYESDYAGVVRGVAEANPRLAGMLVFVLLAAIGSPLFPAFFAMLGIITQATADFPLVATGIVVVWLLWSWSGMQLLQELLVGAPPPVPPADLATGRTMVYVVMLTGLVVAGVYLAERML